MINRYSSLFLPTNEIQKMQNCLVSTIFIFIENRLVAIGGLYDRGSVEVINERKKIICNVDSLPYAFSYDSYYSSATVIPTGILVCGGDLHIANKCHLYKKTTSSWHSFPSMTMSRQFFDMKFLNQGIWAVGGMKVWNENGGRSNTLDHFDLKERVWTRHDIPIHVHAHCLTKLTHDKLIVIGGDYSREYRTYDERVREMTKIF